MARGAPWTECNRETVILLYIGRPPVGHDALADIGICISLSLALFHLSYLTVSQAEGGRRFMRIEDVIMGGVLEEGVGWWASVSRRRSHSRAGHANSHFRPNTVSEKCSLTS